MRALMVRLSAVVSSTSVRLLASRPMLGSLIGSHQTFSSAFAISCGIRRGRPSTNKTAASSRAYILDCSRKVIDSDAMILFSQTSVNRSDRLDRGLRDSTDKSPPIRVIGGDPELGGVRPA